MLILLLLLSLQSNTSRVDYKDYCTNGPQRDCVSLSIITQQQQFGLVWGTLVTLQITNLYGTNPQSLIPSAIIAITVWDRYNQGLYTVIDQPEQPTVNHYSNPLYDWTAFANFQLANAEDINGVNSGFDWEYYSTPAYESSFAYFTFYGAPGAIIGCGVSPYISSGRNFQTCSSNSYVSFSFRSGKLFDAQALAPQIDFSYPNESCDPVSFTSGNTAQVTQNCWPTTATPEPKSMMLVASGLIILALMQAIRKRALSD